MNTDKKVMETAAALNRAASQLDAAYKPNFIDHVRAVFKPSHLIDKAKARYTALFVDQELRKINARSHYKAAEFNRLNQNWTATNGDINTFLKSELKTIRARSRWLLSNNPHAVATINTLLNYIIGVGFSLQMQVRRVDTSGDEPKITMLDGFNEFAEDVFNLWSQDVDIQVSATNPDSFQDEQELVFRKWFEDGEAFIHLAIDLSHPVVPLRLEIIEPEALNESISENPRNKNPVRMGIELEKNTRRPVAYWVYTQRRIDPAFPYQSLNKTMRIPAEEMIHVFKRLRPGQLRGLPHMYAVTQNFFDLDEYTDAELIGNKIAACLAVFITTPAGQTTPLLQNQSGQGATDSAGNPISNLEPGIIANVPQGAEVKVTSPQKPGATFDMFTKYIMRTISGGTQHGLSYIGMTRDTNGVTFAGGRLAQQADFQGFRPVQKFFARKFNDPVFRRWFELAVTNGTFEAPGFFATTPGPAFWLRHVWMPGGWTYGINPLQEVNAARESMRAGITTLDDECAALGHDASTQLQKKARIDKEASALGTVIDSDANVGRISRKGEADPLETGDPAAAELAAELAAANETGDT